jgi:hypothetical protein
VTEKKKKELDFTIKCKDGSRRKVRSLTRVWQRIFVNSYLKAKRQKILFLHWERKRTLERKQGI